MKKGFTLVELLGVIVILALLMLVVFPSVINLIKKSSSKADEITMKLVENATYEYMDEYISRFPRTSGNSYCITLNDLIEKGYLKGPIKINDKDVTSTSSVQVTYNKEFSYELKSIGDCKEIIVEYADGSGANRPELVDGLTPVIYDDNIKQWKIADTKKKWYDYSAKEWANAVILKEGVSNEEGTTLRLPTSPEDASNSDVVAMFVWIPRYEYKMPATVEDKNNPDLIDINFVIKNASIPTEGYILHPGFTFGNQTLSGIWVGKFETSAKAGSSCYNYYNNCNNTTQDPYILPNVYSLRYQTVSNQFKTAKKFNQNLNNALDSHMMKNSEWGAVAYLSHSEYGKQDEVYINNCKNYITGIGADSVNASSTDTTCTNDTNKYNGTSGVNASTTGNVYGIYDMSGGAWEDVMGYLTTAYGSRPWGSTSYDNYAKFTQAPDDKYFDSYTTTTATDEAYNGHALGETSGWYGDYAGFVSSGYPWFTRGGSYSATSKAGVFGFTYIDGNSENGRSFRVVLAPTA